MIKEICKTCGSSNEGECGRCHGIDESYRDQVAWDCMVDSVIVRDDAVARRIESLSTNGHLFGSALMSDNDKPVELTCVNTADEYVTVAVSKRALRAVGQALVGFRTYKGDPNPLLWAVGMQLFSALDVMEGDSLENHPYLKSVDAEFSIFTDISDDQDGQVAARVEETLSSESVKV